MQMAAMQLRSNFEFKLILKHRGFGQLLETFSVSVICWGGNHPPRASR